MGGVAVAGVARAGEVEEEARHPAHGGAGHQVGRVVVVEARAELPKKLGKEGIVVPWKSSSQFPKIQTMLPMESRAKRTDT